MDCLHCRHSNRGGAVFCAQCGSRLARRCARCGMALSAAVRFCDGCGTSVADVSALAGERRPVTIMFCDLVDSTALSERIDPEELGDVLRAYHALCGREIVAFGGHVGRLLGDGVLAYFGYPVAQEHDAQAAVRAGLSIVRGMRDAHQGIAVRVGIHTGLVVIGELGSGQHREWTVMGSTPNIAARLQGLARPNSVVVSGATLKLIDGFFEVHTLGPQVLKGVSARVEVHEIDGERAVYSRVEAAVG